MNQMFLRVGFGLLLVLVTGLILSLPVMWLWNGMLVPAIPLFQEIGWLQAWGIMILCNILVKGVEVKFDA